MIKHRYLLLLLLLVFSSCTHNKIFEKFEKIDNYSWKRNKVIKFEVPIEDTLALYDVSIAIRHTSYYTFANIRVNMMINYPSGDMRVKDYNILVRNKDGTFCGDGAGDLWDVTHLALEKVSFPYKGTYIFEIQNVMPLMETPDIMDVGLIVRKSKKN